MSENFPIYFIQLLVIMDSTLQISYLERIPPEVLSHVTRFIKSPADYFRFRASCSGTYYNIESKMGVSLAVIRDLRKDFAEVWTPKFSRKFYLIDRLDDSLSAELFSTESEHHISDIFARHSVWELRQSMSQVALGGALYQSCVRGYEWLASQLLPTVLAVRNIVDAALPTVVMLNHVGILDLLAEEEVLDLTGPTGRKVLDLYLMNGGSSEMYKALVKYGADFRVVDFQALLIRGIDCDHSVLQHLLKRHLKPEALSSSCTFTSTAARRGDLATLKLLVKYGAPVDPVESIIQAQSSDVIRYLVASHKADINQKHDGESVLSRACMNSGNIHIVRAILKLGAKTSGATGFIALRNSVLHASSTEIVHLLMRHGVDVNAVDAATKRSVLQLMADQTRPQTQVAEFLITRGANVNSCDIRGVTPLMVASMHGNVSLCRLFLHAGAIVDLISQEGETALSYAERGGSDTLIHLIRNFEQLSSPGTKRRRYRLYS